MAEILLKGKILGFDENNEYALIDIFGPDSPFRVLSSLTQPLSFVVVNPYDLIEDYTFEIDEKFLEKEIGVKEDMQNLAVMCIVRIDEEMLYVNLRSPLLINTRDGRFTQVVLENEGYGVAVPFAVKKG